MLTYEKLSKFVSENNKSKVFSDQFVICLIWKETNFEPTAKNAGSSASSLMQMTKGAVEMVNKFQPKEAKYKHADMFDPAINIQCGTLYLDIAKSKLAGVDKSYGTGPGYSKKILLCEIDMKKDSKHPQAALNLIHK